jgi:HK97 family phage prohead protease
MTKKHEHRAAAVTDVSDDGRTFTARAVAYDTTDDYDTRFKPGVFAASLEQRLPVIAWSHDWADPIGRVTDFEDRDDGLYITARLSDPDDVPRARQARSQLADGTLTDVSVGFVRRDAVRAKDGIVDITVADLDEVSLVLRGAVPGATVTSVRSGAVDVDAVVEIAKRKAAGELTDDEARAAIELLGDAPALGDEQGGGQGSEQGSDGGEQNDDDTDDEEPDEVAEAVLEGDLDAALELAVGRSAVGRSHQ